MELVNMKCKVCQNTSHRIFSKKILGRYDADYFKCPECAFIQTSEPVWLPEAYSTAITQLDIGLMNRNLRLSLVVPAVLDACFPKAKTFIDYAGGYGTFVRLMRDEGFNFYRQDIYCENIFAKHFDHADSGQQRYDLLTAFEVFEHFSDPANEIAALFHLADDLVFSTVLYDDTSRLEDWWYLSTETGQHVAFYSIRTLEYLAKKHGKHLYSRDGSLHVFSSRPLGKDETDYAFRDLRVKSSLFGLRKKNLNFKRTRTSLLQQDYEYIKKLIATGQS